MVIILASIMVSHIYAKSEKLIMSNNSYYLLRSAYLHGFSLVSIVDDSGNVYYNGNAYYNGGISFICRI